MQPARVMIKLALNKDVVRRAKGNDKAKFRSVFDDNYKDQITAIERLLDEAGFVGEPEPKPKPSEAATKYRLWPFSVKTLGELDTLAERRGVPRSAIIRAVLIRLARVNDKNQQEEKDTIAARAGVPEGPEADQPAGE